METQERRREWARELCVEVFRSSDVKLREGDSIILVAAVFRKMLDAWVVENQETLDVQETRMREMAGDWESHLGATLKEHGENLRAGLAADIDRADFNASQAVNKALSITGRDAHWKFRGQGFLAGMACVVLVFLLVRIF